MKRKSIHNTPNAAPTPGFFGGPADFSQRSELGGNPDPGSTVENEMAALRRALIENAGFVRALHAALKPVLIPSIPEEACNKAAIALPAPLAQEIRLQRRDVEASSAILRDILLRLQLGYAEDRKGHSTR